MNKRFYAFFLVILILVPFFYSNALAVKNNNINFGSSITQKVEISINHQVSSVELSLEEAEKIKDRFLELEKDFEGIEKINEQINILKEIDILPSDFTLDTLISAINKYNNSKVSNSFFRLLKLTIGFPLIVSHLTIGKRIRCFYYCPPLNLTPPKLIPLNGILDGFYLNETHGYLGAYGGCAIGPVYITAIGPKIMKSSKNPFILFFELLIPCVGFTIAFQYLNSNSPPITLFEYNLDACLFGILGGL